LKPAPEAPVHPRWSRTAEDEAFFRDDDGLRRRSAGLAALAAGLLGLLAAGLWRLQRAALAPPRVIGVAGGQVFTGSPAGLASLREEDFDRQLADTVEVLFGRTERGPPPALAQFCAPEVEAAVSRAYRDAAAKYPAGYVQTLDLLEARTLGRGPGYRRVAYRGLLSSRSVAAAQTSPVYLDCTFALRAGTPLNAAGWRLVRLAALSRDDFYRPERERATRERWRLQEGAGR
jgi:hypothetical protein